MTSFSEKYTVVRQIGEGSFSQVIKVRDANGRYFAAKKLTKAYQSMDEVMEVNEIKAVKHLDYHPNVIGILDILFDIKSQTLYLISELFDMNMYDYIKNRKRCLSEVRVKNFLYQMVRGLNHLHRNDLFHRDIKPENVLIRVDPRLRHNPAKAEIIQLADLGSATRTTKAPPHSAYISTRWYRAPESLLTAGYYNAKIDIWAIGCVFYEILTLNPLFPGENELDQLHKIHDIIGVPSEQMYRKFRHTSVPYNFPKRKATGLHCLVPGLSSNGVDILRRTLHYLPDMRISSLKLLEHAYFNDLRTHEKKIHRAFSSSPSLINSSRSSWSSSTSNTLDSGKHTSAARKSTNNLYTKRHSGIKTDPYGAQTSTKSLSAQMSSEKRTATDMHLRERLWGMNPGNAKNNMMRSITQSANHLRTKDY